MIDFFLRCLNITLHILSVNSFLNSHSPSLSLSTSLSLVCFCVCVNFYVLFPSAPVFSFPSYRDFVLLVSVSLSLSFEMSIFNFSSKRIELTFGYVQNDIFLCLFVLFGIGLTYIAR